jgi:hypothetical protein
VARHGSGRAGRWPVQLHFKTDFTSNEYVKHQAWEDATLQRCPLHPQGGCSFARHGTYERVNPPGTRIPRWYCPEGHCTFSLLADCFACRLTGSLHEVEEVVVLAEQARSREAAANELRLDIELPGALRWLRRRLQAVHTALILVLGLYPDRFAGCLPTVGAFRQRLGIAFVLPALRQIAEAQLGQLPPPLGFRPPSARGGDSNQPYQQQAGPDPPAAIA